ncbi:hypothetical protein R1sor_005697 [Riccia sorocarpa]|uniref:FCP1 homology domain-containing protein n=1 Tax=Riccia sorocarpa TaxID=122646 RepID=A0ABD3HMM5_9MARC
MANLSKKDEEKLLKTDFNKFMSMYPFGTSAIFPIAVEKIMEAPSIFVYRSVNDNYVLETFKNMVEKPHITPQIADLVSVVPSEVGGVSDLAPTPPSEVEEKTDEVPTLPDDFIPRGEYDSIKKRIRSAAEVMKDIDQVVDKEITESGTMNTKEADEQMSSDQRQDDQVVRFELGLLAPIETPISSVPDLNQVPNPLVKASDLLPRKLLILDVEGLLLYAEGFMDKSSKTAAGDVVGAKKVIRRNGVQEFITRCLELFDIALWTCSDRNLLYDYTHYLFSRE